MDRIRRKRQDKRVLAWSLVAAAVLHVAALLLLPGPGPVPIEKRDVELERAEVATGQNLPMDVLFGPPVIEHATRGRSFEPPERILSTERLIFLPGGFVVRHRCGPLGRDMHRTIKPDGRIPNFL